MNLTQRIFKLKTIKPFNNLNDTELILLADIIEVKKFKKNSTIYLKDSTLFNLFIIVEGSVVDEKKNKIYNSFGLKELLNDDVINKSFYANDEVIIFLISKAHLLTLLYESPSLMIGFLSQEEIK